MLALYQMEAVRASREYFECPEDCEENELPPSVVVDLLQEDMHDRGVIEIVLYLRKFYGFSASQVNEHNVSLAKHLLQRT